MLIDGFLQGRKVTRNVKCDRCGQFYSYVDYSMEIIPYDTEYLANFKTRSQVEEENQMRVEELKQKLFDEARRPESMVSESEEENLEAEDDVQE